MRVGLWLSVSLVLLRAAFGKEVEVTNGGNIKQSASKVSMVGRSSQAIGEL